MSMGAAPRDEATLRTAIRRAHLADEDETVRRLATATGLDAAARARIANDAAGLVRELRGAKQPGVMETFLAEYGLTTREGVALMCLAEALLRVPDVSTIDALIEDKIGPADWGRHLGHSGSPLVNASTWALMLTGKVIGAEESSEWDLIGTLRALIKRAGEPVIRRAVVQSMRVLGHQFVLGRDIHEAVARAAGNEAKGYTYSYDMLGEEAHTAEDAQRYFLSYSKAIALLSDRCVHGDTRENPGVSVKLSALHPRYEFAQRRRVLDELVPRVASLALLAKNANMGFSIDAEEADRLDLSLDVIEAVLASPDLKGWDGFGAAVQTYLPRAPHVIEWLHDLALRLDRRITVRLVKGAYWDGEIKKAQVLGLPGYPVFTRKVSTDICYLACARRLLDLSDRIYPQFATHTAHTAAAVLEMAGDFEGFELQRLHGMGESLHELLRRRHGRACRIYAPVGIHRDLLAYLVRRLLENGANSSFVNQLLDETVPPDDLVRDPLSTAEGMRSLVNPRIPSPPDLYRPERANAKGWNLADPLVLAELERDRAAFRGARWRAAPLVAGAARKGTARAVLDPADHADLVGEVVEAGPELIDEALSRAVAAVEAWRAVPVEERAACLERTADLYERHAPELMALAAREAGKTLPDSIAEVREAVDFCRYYAALARQTLAGNECRGRGVFVCISPWNFPLAIFTGQVTAALVCGNPVVAKPAEQTPLIAARAVALMLEAGVPADALCLMPGDGPSVGGALASDPRVAGICFTGSTETARAINRTMAERGNPRAPLIAETGGLNAMIVDSSALLEQAVRDIVTSAFQSAGQRCSALRVLFVQTDIAERLLKMLEGAMDELAVGDPWDLATDVGPVIDRDAQAAITAHERAMEEKGRLIKRVAVPEDMRKAGTFVPPVAYRLDDMAELEREVFGPVLHVVTYAADALERVIESVNASGYGLTLGLHTRVDRRVQRICERARVGNIYVNRNQIGAVVGVQPFGGEGLSGTGPKAGGPHYLARFVEATAPVRALRPAPAVRDADPAPDADADALAAAAEAQRNWERRRDRREVLERAARACSGALGEWVRAALDGLPAIDPEPIDLPGPTGESNRLSLHGRGVFLCLGSGSGAAGREIVQAVAAVATGNGAVLAGGEVSESDARAFAAALTDAGAPPGLTVRVDGGRVDDIVATAAELAGVVLEDGGDRYRSLRRALAAREGPILAVIDGLSDIAPFVIERTLCVDTTASGGNAALLAMAERPD